MSSLKKKCIVVMLPTEKAQLGSILLVPDNKYQEHLKGWLKINRDNSGMQFTKITPQHLYICSTDEIKEGDWYYSKAIDSIFQAITFPLAMKDALKIIATTDSSLYIQGDKMEIKQPKGFSQFYSKQLPSVSDSFIQAFIKAYNEGKPIVDVMVEYEQDIITKRVLVDHNPADQFVRIDLTLKLRNNEVIITKVKDSWSREELEYMVNNYALDVLIAKNSGFSIPYYIDWINKHI